MALTLTIEENQIDTGGFPPRGGRPTTYKPQYAHVALGACLLGANFSQLAEIFGITEKTLVDWMDANPEFAEAMREGQDVADAKVMRSFYQRAVGYDHTARRTTVTRRTRGRGEAQHEIVHQEVVETVTHIPADITAAKQWLRLRRGWGDNETGTLDDLLRLAALARAEAARRGLDLAAPRPPVIEARDSGPGADDGADAAA